MRFYSSLACFAAVVLSSTALIYGQNARRDARPPLRIAIVGLVHGHVQGFFEHSLHNPEIEIVGIAEPDQSLASQYMKRYGLDPKLLFSDLETTLARTHPQAVLVYTNTFDHRRVVETCARHGIHVMMEKPLAVSFDDAKAIEKAAAAGRIQVLVNYEVHTLASGMQGYII